MSATAGFFFLLSIALSGALLLLGITPILNCLVEQATSEVRRWRRNLAWLGAVSMLPAWYSGFMIWIVDSDTDIIPWIYAGGWIAAGAFLAMNGLMVKSYPLCRAGSLVVVRLFIALFIAIQADNFAQNAFESVVIQQRKEAAKGSAYGLQGVYSWGDGGNSMTTSEGLANYGKRTPDAWRRNLGECGIASLILLPLLLVMERMCVSFFAIREMPKDSQARV